LYGGVERCLIEGFHINSVGSLSTSGQIAGFVVRSEDNPPVSSAEDIDTTEVNFSRVRQIYSVIQKDGLNFVRLYFLNYTCYVNDLHNI